MVLMIFKMRSSLLTTLVTGEQSFFLTASGPFVLAEFPQQLPCACTCELSFSLLCRITNIAGQLVRNECNILSLGGIKASEDHRGAIHSRAIAHFVRPGFGLLSLSLSLNDIDSSSFFLFSTAGLTIYNWHNWHVLLC